ncbi:hypothetical protein, partial [Sphingorhabdus sp.]|uniref:hypothetical protein n=1 Tax=Sphingorhabdus sp. TaxID=1902408 RepID=UPI0035948442
MLVENWSGRQDCSKQLESNNKKRYKQLHSTCTAMDFRAPAQLIYTDSAQWSIAMAFITDKEKLKSG